MSNSYEEAWMEEIINQGVERSNAIHNLSERDDFRSSHDLESDESDDDGDTDNSNTDSDEEDGDREYIPTAPWFTTQEISNNDVGPGESSNINPLNNHLFEGQCFTDKQAAVDAIKTHHISESRNYRVVKSTTVLYEAKCVVQDCPWRIRVIQRKRLGHFEITKLPALHNCLLRTVERDHKKISSRFIANTIKQQITESPNLKVGNIRIQISEIYKYDVSYKKAWLGKQKAISDIYGDCKTSYSKLPMFLTALMHYNPGTIALIESESHVMMKIRELNPAAEEWLRNIPLEMWTMSHDGGHRYGQATTNMIETFNGVIKSARFLPITSMMEYLYYRSVKIIAERRTQELDDIQNGNIYCKNSRDLFENIEKKASTHKIVPYNSQRGIFEVITTRYKTNTGYWKGGNKHIINLEQGNCSCGKWQRYHSPCSHVVAGCLICHLDWKQYIEPYHSLATSYEMWHYEFQPLANEAYWNFPLANGWERYGELVPDENLRKKKKKRGEKGQSQRIRTEMDYSQRGKCGRCGQEGHTRRSKKCPQKEFH